MFEINYKKNNNKKLFEYLEKNGFSNIQNYIPLYSLYFSINENNYNNINLNNKSAINNILNRKDNNNFQIKFTDTSNDTKHTINSFFKFSPLLDPVKFMVGKYKHLSDNTLCSLPRNKNNICCKKVLDTNNSAYVDSFFSYLSSKLNTEMGFIHGIQFFGSFLSVQNEFKINIYDDLEYLFDSPFFHENKNKLFDIEDIDEEKMLESDTRNYRKKIKLENNDENILIRSDKLDNEIFGGLFEELTIKNLQLHNSDIKEEYSKENITKNKTQSVKKTNSTCSSRSSNTHESEKYSSVGEDSEEQSYSEGSLSNSQMSEYSSMESDENVNATVYNFPVQIISLEKLDNTLDSLLEDEDNELTDKEWVSCLFQIIMILITYQKIFNFTHNDLHTNNIMYCETDKKFINYKYNNIYYRVPTYGKIYKIIDFGRAIYSFKGKTMCSDSYHPKGDAATQYNFKPYFNEKKPRLEPNKSFDLCRLGCSLFDYFIEDIEEQKTIKDPIAKLIIEWTKDDKGRNILYKNNGEERYPEFKLYKMIVRTVHKHLPETQLSNKLFSSFISSKRKIKKQKIINIDKMESMC